MCCLSAAPVLATPSEGPLRRKPQLVTPQFRTQSVTLHLICIRVSQIQSYLPYSPPSFSSSFSLSHSRTHTARLFLLEMPGGLGSAIWSPPSAEETFAGSECSFPPVIPQGPRSGSRAEGRPPGGAALCWAAPFPSAVSGQRAGVHKWGEGSPAPDTSSIFCLQPQI